MKHQEQAISNKLNFWGNIWVWEHEYQVQDGSKDLIDSLDLFCGESYHLHGICYSFEIGTVIDGGLQMWPKRMDNDRHDWK